MMQKKNKLLYAASVFSQLAACAALLYGAYWLRRTGGPARLLLLAAALIAARLAAESVYGLLRSRAPASGQTEKEAALTAQVLDSQAEISSLQSQINPHFLYNTLETIRGKALAHKEEDIATMIEMLARLFRYNISRSDKVASLAEEVENVRNYITIQNFRFENRFRLIEDFSDLGETIDRCLLPTLTLQPLVENAIHHGLERKEGRGTILLRGFLTDEELIVQVQDDGVGIDEETLAHIRDSLMHSEAVPVSQKSGAHNGIALANVQRRIRLSYGANYGLNIMSASGFGTKVEIVLPKAVFERRGHFED